MISNNFNLRERDISKAAGKVLRNERESGGISFSTEATLADRWEIFARYIKSKGIRKMEKISRELVIDYGKELADQVRNLEMATSTAQNYVSAVNTVMTIATAGNWKSVSPTKDAAIPFRTAVRLIAPEALSRSSYLSALETVRLQMGERASAIMELARELGLRSKEVNLLDVHNALEEAQKDNKITIDAGSKGGRKRQLPITPRQLEVLERAALVQGNARSVMPPQQNWKTWREGELREIRELVQTLLGGGLHDLRAAYACERYFELTGHAAPCAGGKIIDKNLDESARLTIAEELGHSRIDVVSAYIGGRK